VEITSLAITTAMVMEGPPMVVEGPMMEGPMMEGPTTTPTTTVSRHDEEAPERTMPNGIARMTAARDGMIISNPMLPLGNTSKVVACYCVLWKRIRHPR
jgi:hypothetical protein